MHNLKVSKFMGIDNVDIDMSDVTLIAGKNAQGKTSIHRAIASCICETIPLNIAKKDIKDIIKNGYNSSEIIFSGNTFKVSVTFPDAKKHVEGDTFEISRVAAGLTSIVDSKKQDIERDFVELLKCYPTKSDLEQALTNSGHKTIVESLWKSIETFGWDTTLENASKKGSTLKGEWSGITGEKYGEKKAENWIHKDTYNEMPEMYSRLTEQNKTEKEKLTEFIDYCKATISATMRDEGATEEQIKTLNDLVKKGNNVDSLISEIEKEIEGLNSSKELIEKELSKKATVDDMKPILCPHCNKGLNIINGNIVKAVDLTKEQIDENNKNIIQCKIDIDRLCDEIKAKNVLLYSKTEIKKNATEASEKLSKISKKRSKHVDKDEVVSKLNTWIDSAVKRMNALTINEKANAIHSKIKANVDIIEILKPEGVRRMALVRALSELNVKLKNICDIANWPRHVVIDGDMSISLTDTVYNTNYHLCSKAEKFCIRAALQIATALYDGSKYVLIDDSDDVLGKWRSGIVSAIIKNDLKAVLLLATSKKDTLPDMGKINGKTYWIENGKSEEVKH